MAHAVAGTDWAGEIIRIAQEAAPSDFHGDPKHLKVWTGIKEADGTGWATFTLKVDDSGDKFHEGSGSS